MTQLVSLNGLTAHAPWMLALHQSVAQDTSNYTSTENRLSIISCQRSESFVTSMMDYCNYLLFDIDGDLLCHVQSLQNAAGRLVINILH